MPDLDIIKQLGKSLGRKITVDREDDELSELDFNEQLHVAGNPIRQLPPWADKIIVH